MEQREKKKLVYRLPMLIIPALALVFMGGVFWRLLSIRAKGWMYVAAAVIIILVALVAMIYAYLSSRAWEKDDAVLEKKMAFTKWLTLELQNLEGRMSAGAAKDTVHALYEDARFSDPMSNAGTEEKEMRIGELIVKLTEAVRDKNDAGISELAEEIKLLISERNRICKASK